MRYLRYIIFLYLIIVGQLISQTKFQYDTLFILNKKYLLKKSENHFTNVSDFPYSIFTTQYHSEGKSIECKIIKEENCLLTSEFNFYGNEIIKKICVGNEKSNYQLMRFTDSIKVKSEKLKDISILIKRKTGFIPVDRMQYIAVFDSSTYSFQIDGSAGNELVLYSDLTKIKSLPKYIILNMLFYSDDKKKHAYYLPCEFVIIPN